MYVIIFLSALVTSGAGVGVKRGPFSNFPNQRRDIYVPLVQVLPPNYAAAVVVCFRAGCCLKYASGPCGAIRTLAATAKF